MPSPYLDDLNGGPTNGYKKDPYPDFAIGTPNGRGLKYNTLYYTRNIIDKGEANTGYVAARMSATGRPNILQAVGYCYNVGRGKDSACYFNKRTPCLVGVDLVPMTKSRRYKLEWTPQQESDQC